MATASFAIAFPLSPPPPPLRRSLSNSCHLSCGGRWLRRRSPLRLVRSSSDSDSAVIEVVGIGSRKDAVIDFCLNSSSSSSSRLRFWTFHSGDSQKVQLLQWCHGSGIVSRDLEFPPSLHPPAMILVASAGHGMDHIAAIELLNSVKSTGGIAAAILLKPFGFEGQRRLEEVDHLVQKLQVCSHFYIVVEADSLLKAEVETLTEALESVNNAVFLAMKAISVLILEVHLKVLNTTDGQMRELRSIEVLKLLESYGEAKVGFGAGYNLRSAIIQALYHCPFLCSDLKDMSGVVFFTLSNSCDFNEGDLPATVLNFRQITECTSDVIFSRIHEPDLEPNLNVITLLIVSSKEKRISRNKSLLSDLSLHLHSLLSFLGRDLVVQNSEQLTHLHNKSSIDATIPSDSDSASNSNLTDRIIGINFEHKENHHPIGKTAGGGMSEASCESMNFQTQADSGVHGDDDSNFSAGAGFNIAHLWATERATFVGSKQIERMNIFTLPVGVKSSSEMNYNFDGYSKFKLPQTSNNMNTESLHNASFPSDTLPDTGLEAFTEIYNSALSLMKGRNVDDCRKRGLISERAASMLESERESPKSWTPIVDMQYRGGLYRGRCQGGLPEGKGCLTFSDGSFYDGMWHYGKRSGLGTLCYSNGDMFQGAWRDDLMHGRGWFYFHTGDRWFANFWKGKANGQGRFYSENGSIFLGGFQNSWRHGEGLYIDADGSRWAEIWEEGILVSRTLLEKGDEK